MTEEMKLTLEDHENAKKEVAFLLNVLTQTIPEIVNAELVSREAGSAAAEKMPIDFESFDLKYVIDSIIQLWKDGFEISYNINDGQIEFTFTKCALKEICELCGHQPGDDFCAFFHSYFNGMLGKHTKEKYEVKNIKAGDSCSIVHQKREL
jgi:hypothetical protein